MLAVWGGLLSCILSGKLGFLAPFWGEGRHEARSLSQATKPVIPGFLAPPGDRSPLKRGRGPVPGFDNEI